MKLRFNDRQIRAAAFAVIRYLKEHGWCQGFGGGRKSSNARCLMRATSVVSPFRLVAWAQNVISRAEAIVIRARRRHRWTRRHPLARWNDQKGRTLDEVLALLRMVANWHTAKVQRIVEEMAA